MRLDAFLEEQRQFSELAFGPGLRTKGIIDHITKELAEIEAKPTDLFEWIDVITLALDGAWRAGHSSGEICDALQVKLTRNKRRDWPDWRTVPEDQAIEHIREEEGSPYAAPDSELVDTSDIPEAGEDFFDESVHAKFGNTFNE